MTDPSSRKRAVLSGGRHAALGVGWGCRDDLTDPSWCPKTSRAAKGSERPHGALLAAQTGVWSAFGDLYCEKVRTLSTNWNLKFQRGETEGPYPRVEMALGFFPPRLLFSVLISPWFPAPLPG